MDDNILDAVCSFFALYLQYNPGEYLLNLSQ